jgi:TorA maturation chaperone TorD
MNSAQVGQARHHSYVLFSRLLRGGLTPELRPFVEQIPELADSLTKAYDEDIAAAHHENIFGFNLFPLQSIFLDVRGLAGGTEAKRVRKFYITVGFAEEKGVDADHMAQLLLCLAQLCQSESGTARQQQANLLGQHILRWLLPFTGALKQQGRDFYACVADL